VIEYIPAAGGALRGYSPSRYSAHVRWYRGPLYMTQPRNTDCSLSHGVSCSDHVYPAFKIKKGREIHTRARKEEEDSDARTDELEGGTARERKGSTEGG